MLACVVLVAPLWVACSPAGPDVVDLEALVARFAEDVPRRGSEAMVLPTAQQSALLVDGIRAARAGRPERAVGLLGPIGYVVRTVVDSATGRTAHVVAEQVADGVAPHGWGMYVVSSRPEGRLVVEVTHPVFDIGTPEVGVAAFREADAAVLMVAGTHRYANRDGSSDVAHDARTMLARVHRALVSTGDVVLQPHGFDAGRDGAPGTAAGSGLVVSSGAAPPSRVVLDVASALGTRGFAVCVYDGDRCSELGATGNVQGTWCRQVGASFVHLELSRTLRDDRRAWTAAVAATVEGIARPAASADAPDAG